MAKPDEIAAGPSTAPARPALSDAELERRRGRPWTLQIVQAFDIAPHMRRVQLTADNLADFQPKPGQEIVLQLPQPNGEVARRHYTIRRFDRATNLIDVDFVLHGHPTPAVAWALHVRPGESVDIRGPRGRMSLDPVAAWYLFLGDETAIPAILSLLEALPSAAKSFAFVEIGREEDRQSVDESKRSQIVFCPRNGAPGPNDVLFRALAGFSLPDGRGQAFALGETSNVRALRHALIERGLDRSQIYSEGYWRPGRIGGHDHVDE